LSPAHELCAGGRGRGEQKSAAARPAVSERDEREETPWPILGEAAKIGLYGFEALAQFSADPFALTLPIVNEELFWGDAGIGMAIMGSSLAAAGI
jgi:acyl-CoA dehydrogenase